MEWQLLDNKREYIIFMPLQNAYILLLCSLADLKYRVKNTANCGYYRNISPAVEKEIASDETIFEDYFRLLFSWV